MIRTEVFTTMKLIFIARRALLDVRGFMVIAITIPNIHEVDAS